MKTGETLAILGIAGLGLYALSQKQDGGLGGITNILEAPVLEGGGGLPSLNFPSIPSFTFNWPSMTDFNLPSIPDWDWPELPNFPGLPDMPTLPNVPKVPGAQGLGKRLGGYLAGGVKSGILGFGQGVWDQGAEERAGYAAFAEGVAQPTWMPFGRLAEGLRRMANQMAGGGHLGGVSPGIGISEQNPLDPYERGDEATIHAGIASGLLNPAGMPWESAAKKPGATPPATQGEASAIEPEPILTDKQKLQASWND